MGLEDTEDLATSDGLDKGDTVLVTEEDANLRRHLTLLGSLGDHLLHLQTSIERPRQQIATDK
jgi:ABC-type metal ion transport system substrate-binding protein